MVLSLNSFLGHVKNDFVNPVLGNTINPIINSNIFKSVGNTLQSFINVPLNLVNNLSQGALNIANGLGSFLSGNGLYILMGGAVLIGGMYLVYQTNKTNKSP